MKRVIRVVPATRWGAGEALNALFVCMRANGLEIVRRRRGELFWLWKPSPVDDIVPLETLDNLSFHPGECLTARFDYKGDDVNVVFVSLFFSEVDLVNLVELETDGRWVDPDNIDCPVYEVKYREWSRKRYSLAKCLHQSLNARETRIYDDYSPDHSHFLLTGNTA